MLNVFFELKSIVGYLMVNQWKFYRQILNYMFILWYYFLVLYNFLKYSSWCCSCCSCDVLPLVCNCFYSCPLLKNFVVNLALLYYHHHLSFLKVFFHDSFGVTRFLVFNGRLITCISVFIFFMIPGLCNKLYLISMFWPP